MEMVDIVATANFVSSRLGNVTRKQRLTVARHIADEFVRLGVAKINPLRPLRTPNPSLTEPLAGGGAEVCASLPAGQALPRPTAMLLQPQAGNLSSSTTVGDVHPLPTFYGDAMAPGGMSTTKPSRKTSKVSGGRKTLKLPSATTLAASEALINPD